MSHNPVKIKAARDRLNIGAALSKQDIAALVGVTARSVERWVAEGSFPQPDICIGERLIRWSAAIVRPFVDGKAS